MSIKGIGEKRVKHTFNIGYGGGNSSAFASVKLKKLNYKGDIIMNELNRFVLINKGNSRAIPATSFSSKGMYDAYTSTINALRNSLDRLQRLEYAGANIKETEARTDECYEALRACYKWFADKESNFKMKPCETDLEALKAISRENVKAEGVEGKTSVAKSLVKFRKAFEDFAADRINGEVSKSTAEIDAEKKAKAAARRAKRQAEAEAKKALEAKTAA